MAFWGPSLHTELVAPCLGRSLACLLQLHYCICCSCKSACLAKFMLNKPVPRPYARSWRDFQLSSSCKCWETFAAIKPTARGEKEGKWTGGRQLELHFFFYGTANIFSVYSQCILGIFLVFILFHFNQFFQQFLWLSSTSLCFFLICLVNFMLS